MEPLKIIVDNFPAQEQWYIEWAPIFIAVIALVVSMISLYWSRKQFMNLSRPYCWLIDWAVLNEQQKVVDMPHMVAIKVRNVPVKIIIIKYHFYFISGVQKREIHNHENNNIIRFPDENTQSTYSVGDFDQYLKTRNPDDKLRRDLRVDYTGLSGNNKYMYESHSEYDFKENRWRVISENAI